MPGRQNLFFLRGLSYYKNMKALLRSLLVRNTSKEFLWTNSFLGFVTILSVLSIALETVSSLSQYKLVFLYIEYFAVFIFTLEYFARIYAYNNKKRYIFSLVGVIDLVAILPSLFGMLNLTFLKSARVFRVLIFLRTMRLGKLTRLNKFSNLNSKKAKEIQFISVRIYGIVLATTTFVFATLLYLVEGGNPLLQDIPSGILWVALVIFGGGADVESFSLLAKIVVIGIQFSGLLLFGLLIHLVGKFLERRLLGSATLAE